MVDNLSLGDMNTLNGDEINKKGELLYPGDEIGGYKIIHKLGAGGMGQVYLVENIQMHKKYAMKVLPPNLSRDKRFIDRFRVEARVMSDLKHPNIVDVKTINHDKFRNLYYLVMEFIEFDNGKSADLGSLLKGKRKLSEEDALRIVKQLCSALDYAHNFRKDGVIHRDLKPANILIDSNADAHITDFGLAKVVGTDYLHSMVERSIQLTMASNKKLKVEQSIGDMKTIVDDETGSSYSENESDSAGSIIGTYEFMSPEQREGEEATKQSDIYSLGMIIYKLLTGKKAVGRFKLPTHFGKSEYWDDIIVKCLENEPEDRFESVDGILRILVTANIEDVKTDANTIQEENNTEEKHKIIAENDNKDSDDFSDNFINDLKEKPLQKRIYLQYLYLFIASFIFCFFAIGRGIAGGFGGAIAMMIIPSLFVLILRKKGIIVSWIVLLLIAILLFLGSYSDTKKNILNVQSVSKPENKKQTSPLYEKGEKYYKKYNIPSDLIPINNASYSPTKDLASGSATAQEKQIKAVKKTGLPLEVETFKYGIKMRLIPAGTFTMGSPSSEDERADSEGPQHKVTISKPFYMGKYEVTQQQWEDVMGSNPSRFKNAGSNAPVESVSWDDCQEFLNKLCDKLGVSRGTYRLPTEAEWEYAARAGTTGKYYGDIDSIAWYDNNSGSKTHTVGSKKPNAFGLYDTAGNVWEWCSDGYGDYSSGSQTDPVGASTGWLRVYRGGGWNGYARGCRSAYRNYGSPGDRDGNLGFRFVRLSE